MTAQLVVLVVGVTFWSLVIVLLWRCDPWHRARRKATQALLNKQEPPSNLDRKDWNR